LGKKPIIFYGTSPHLQQLFLGRSSFLTIFQMVVNTFMIDVFCLHAEAPCKVAESLLLSPGFAALLTKIYP
jgi:hypothetical protein